MGDRTTVRLRILESQKDQVEGLWGHESAEEEFEGLNGKTMYFEFHEVNYGNLGFLDQLRDAGIPYDSQWDAGSEYGEGTTYLPFHRRRGLC